MTIFQYFKKNWGLGILLLSFAIFTISSFFVGISYGWQEGQIYVTWGTSIILVFGIVNSIFDLRKKNKIKRNIDKRYANGKIL